MEPNNGRHDQIARRPRTRLVSRLLLAALALLSLSPLRAAAPPKISCDALRLLKLKRDPALLLIDVRPPGEFLAEHIQGAQNAPDVERANLPRDKRIVVYCGESACPLSSNAAQRLIADGYPDVQYLDGGLAAWDQKHYPVLGGNATPQGPRPRATAKDAKTKLDAGQALALDVRPALEFSAGRLPKAVNLPLENLDAALSSLPKDKEIIVYDRRPDRSRQAFDKLKAAGYNVKELAGGFAAWVLKQHPVEVK